MGVDLDTLWATIERARQQQSAAREELARRIEDVHRAKQEALEAQQFERAARLRDQERELREQARAQQTVRPEMLREIRRRVGIPSSPDDAASPPENG